MPGNFINNTYVCYMIHLELFCRNCGLEDPTWSELRHYVHFLSSQLTKVLASPFCGPSLARELPGFKSFVVKFMLTMAKVKTLRAFVNNQDKFILWSIKFLSFMGLLELKSY